MKTDPIIDESRRLRLRRELSVEIGHDPRRRDFYAAIQAECRDRSINRAEGGGVRPGPLDHSHDRSSTG